MRQACKLIIFLALVALVLVGAVAWINTNEATYGIATDDPDSIRDQVKGLQSLVGLDRWAFDFHLPPEHKLLILLEAEFNGEPYEEMTTTIRVVPEWPSVDSDGKVFVSFYHPNFQTVIPDPGPRWWQVTVSADSTRRDGSHSIANSFRFASPFDPSRGRSGGGQYVSGGKLMLGQDVEVWEESFHYHYSGRATTEQEPYEFKLRMSFRLEESSADDELGSIQEVRTRDAAQSLSSDSTELLPIEFYRGSESQ